MLREISANLASILPAASVRDTLDLYLADNTTRRLSRGNLTRTIDGGSVIYSNWLKSVGELRYSLSNEVDSVQVVCQNVNSLLGFDIASNLRLLDYAHARIGKFYQSIRDPNLTEDVTVEFIGILSNAEANHEEIKFDVIVDFDALGSLLASRNLSPRCWWRYKDGINCHSTSNLLTCPKNRAACIERGAEWEFGGWEFFEQPVASPPVGGDDDPPPREPPPRCFTGDTPVLTSKGQIPFAAFYNSFYKNGFNSIINFNEQTGEVESDKAIEVFKHTAHGYFELEFAGGARLKVTPEHPFWNEYYQFIAADQLKLKDRIWRYLDKIWVLATLERVKWHSDAKVEVYNLHARRNKTYFANNFAVHNIKIFPL